jgi:heavy metal translocating P-type ATPase
MNAPELETTYDLEGLTCASCVAKVERAIRSAAPDAAVAVSLPQRTARVRGAASEAVVAAVVAAGYGATPRAPGDDGQAEVEAARRHAAEVGDAGRRALAGLLLGAPLAVLGMGEMLTGRALVEGSDRLQAGLAALLVVVAAPLLSRGLAAIVRLAPTMDSLVALGALAAFGASAVALLQGHASHGHLHFEAAGLILALVLVGRFLEARATGQAGDALRRLLDLRPALALVVGEGGDAREVPAAEVRPGQRVRVLPGARVPVDGRVLEGTSALSEALLTGEPMPVRRGPGDPVAAGTTNGEGALLVLAERTGQETELARIASLVAAAQGTKAPIERLADAVAGRLVPVVAALAALTAAGWLLAGAGTATALWAAIAVLVVACPCALGLATPVVVVVAVGRAAAERILVRDAASLEALAGVTHVLLDKTGTLTEGRPTVVERLGPDADRALRLAAAVEQQSEHPLARAVVEAARQAGLLGPAAQDVTATPGAGVEGAVAEAGAPFPPWVLVGSPAWLATRLVPAAELAPLVAAAEARAATAVGVAAMGADGSHLVGGLLLADPLRPGAADAVRDLVALGLTPLLVTGDAEAPARAIARAVGITDVRAGVRPKDKLEVVTALERGGARVAAVGDGVNDAPALAAATVGVAMGGGTDAARAAASLTLLDDDPRRLVLAIRLARAARRTIRQNLAWAFGYNVVAVPLAALGLLPPVVAAGAMALSSILVVGNGLRLRRTRVGSTAAAEEAGRGGARAGSK